MSRTDSVRRYAAHTHTHTHTGHVIALERDKITPMHSVGTVWEWARKTHPHTHTHTRSLVMVMVKSDSARGSERTSSGCDEEK